MDSDLFVKILFGVGAVIVAAYEIRKYFFRRCPKCQSRLRLDEIRDSMGHNLSKTVTLSFWKGPRKITEIWKCRECGYEITEKSWKWQ